MSQLMHKLAPLLRPLNESVFKTNVTICGPAVLSVRHRKPIYPRKHVEPDFVRKQMLAVCEPVFAADKRLPSERCYNLTPKPDRQIHPYDKMLAQDMSRELRTSRMICFFHENQVTGRERTYTANTFTHEGMTLRYYNPDVARLAMDGTKWEAALHLCSEYRVTVLFSPEPSVAKVLKLVRKSPQLVLMAAIIDDRFLSLEDLKDYNRLPDLQTMRAHLCHTLSSATRSVTDKTLHPMLTLTNSIDIYIKDKK